VKFRIFRWRQSNNTHNTKKMSREDRVKLVLVGPKEVGKTCIVCSIIIELLIHLTLILTYIGKLSSWTEECSWIRI
jgi:polynucleotide 5'-kinase involved in rRNA processing